VEPVLVVVPSVDVVDPGGGTGGPTSAVAATDRSITMAKKTSTRRSCMVARC
jgi:hypothetical protein